VKKITFLLFLLLLCTLGCQPANVIAVKWDTGLNADKAKTRCERVDMRDKADMDAIFQKYDGWKLIYVSEYTTGNRLGTDAAVCFERSK
jgi:hypothetical protein